MNSPAAMAAPFQFKDTSNVVVRANTVVGVAQARYGFRIGTESTNPITLTGFEIRNNLFDDMAGNMSAFLMTYGAVDLASILFANIVYWNGGNPFPSSNPSITTDAAGVEWLWQKLLPRLRRGDVLLMDNLKAHRDSRVDFICWVFGVRVIYLPPYSPDLNPIEPGWALQKQFVRKTAPRCPKALRRIARRARYRITPRLADGGSSTQATWVSRSDRWDYV
jgi:transposase